MELAHHDAIHEDLHTLVLASVAMEYELTDAVNSAEWKSPFPLQRLHFATLVLDAPELALYDVTKDKLTRTHWLVLRFNFEVGGRMATRFVDVVTASHCSLLVETHKEALTGLHAALVREFGPINMAANAEKMRHPRPLITFANASQWRGS